MKRDDVLYMIFFIFLFSTIFYIADSKMNQMDEYCSDICFPDGFHVKTNGIEFKCACEEKMPGVIRFKNGK